MEDIGRHPDSGNPIENEHEYETIEGYGTTCPFCEEDIELEYDLEGLFWAALDSQESKDKCWNCGAELKISYVFIELAEDFCAMVQVEVEATKRMT